MRNADPGVETPGYSQESLRDGGGVGDAAGKKSSEKQEIDEGRQNLVQPVPDPNYTVRAWRAVVTYLFRQQDFLYE